VIAQVASGHPYYASVAMLHRKYHYPLRPFVTVRLPMLAWLSAGFGQTGTFILYLALLGACIVSWGRRFWQLFAGRPTQYFAQIVVALSFGVTANPILMLFHEAWAGGLIAVALALWRPERYGASVILLLAATLFREIAVCALLLMGSFAALEQRWRELQAYGLAFIVFIAVMIAHASAVAQIVRADDLASPGWAGHGGWPLVVSVVMTTSPLILAPRWLAALILPLMFFGWAFWRDALGLRILGVVIGYALAVALFARPDTFYWSLLFTPLLTLGVLFVPKMVREIVDSMRDYRIKTG